MRRILLATALFLATLICFAAESGGLFIIDLETGDLSQASASQEDTGFTLEASTDAEAHGTYGLLARKDSGTNNDCWIQKTFSDQTNFYVRVYFYVDAAMTGTQNTVCYVVQVYDGSTALGYFGGRNTDADTSVWNSWRMGGQSLAAATSTTGFSQGAWHYVELHWVAHATTGGMEVWIDDTETPIFSDLDNDTSTYAADNIIVGIDAYTPQGDGQYIYFDDIKADTSRVGAYSEGASTYSVTYDGNGSEYGTVPTDASSPYEEDETVTVLGNTGVLRRTDYTWECWNTAANGSGTDYDADDTFAMPASNVVLYAQWVEWVTPHVYYVAKTGSDSTGDGSESYPWLTIQHGVDAADAAGDVLYVKSGTYDETVDVDTNSGSAGGGYISIVAYPGDTVVTRLFSINGISYVQIIGFEITHEDATRSYAILFSTAASDHVRILDNYIHNIHGQGGMIRWIDLDNQYITIRGNHLYWGNGAQIEGHMEGNGWGIQARGGDYHLIEYNRIHRCGDFVNMHASNSVVRNNWIYDFDEAYWPEAEPNVNHADIFQPSAAPLAQSLSQYQVYEANLAGDNVEANSHFLQIRTENTDEHHMLFRGNVGYRFGSYVLQCGGWSYHFSYNNTFHSMCQTTTASLMYYNSESTYKSENNLNFNNLFSSSGTGAPISLEAGGEGNCTSSYNWGYSTGAHASLVGTTNPLFVGALSDWHLQAGSPVIDQGTYLTTVASATGSGTEFDVAAGTGVLLFDGYGVAEGDLISVGSESVVRVTDVTADTVTVASSVSWELGDGVYWRHQGSTPDIGAYPYRAGGYGLSATMAVAENGTITATPNDTQLARMVEFFVNSVPLGTDYDSPYSQAWDVSGLADATYEVKVRAYPLYASDTLWYETTYNAEVSGGLVGNSGGGGSGDSGNAEIVAQGLVGIGPLAELFRGLMRAVSDVLQELAKFFRTDAGALCALGIGGVVTGVVISRRNR